MFGEQVELTPDICDKIARYFDFYLVAQHLLTKEGLEKFKSIDEYNWQKYLACSPDDCNSYHEYMELKARTFAEIYNSEETQKAENYDAENSDC